MGFFDSLWTNVKKIDIKLQNGLQVATKVGKEVLQQARMAVRPLKEITEGLKPLNIPLFGNVDSILDIAIGGMDLLDQGLSAMSNWLDGIKKD